MGPTAQAILSWVNIALGASFILLNVTASQSPLYFELDFGGFPADGSPEDSVFETDDPFAVVGIACGFGSHNNLRSIIPHTRHSLLTKLHYGYSYY
ncbi:hypothetical protein L208DRAFT_1394923 [Tricholoma matsutake]|nr:hypothetical protein L208DRAFT_1394923 [Tricholoma matsutake 945]